MADYSAIVRALPDIHRHVEARALLRSSACDVFGFDDSMCSTGVVRDADGETIFVVGRPDVALIETVLRQSPLVREVVAGTELAPWLRETLPAWTHSTIAVYRLPDDASLPQIADTVRFVDPSTLRDLRIDAELLEELRDGAEGSPIAGSFVDGAPIAFCYAGAITESLWDIAIDTLEAHRRQGHAGRCVAYMVRYMRTQRKQPVWQAALNNPPSWKLAAKLGFERVDELAFVQRD